MPAGHPGFEVAACWGNQSGSGINPSPSPRGQIPNTVDPNRSKQIQIEIQKKQMTLTIAEQNFSFNPGAMVGSGRTDLGASETRHPISRTANEKSRVFSVSTQHNRFFKNGWTQVILNVIYIYI